MIVEVAPQQKHAIVHFFLPVASRPHLPPCIFFSIHSAPTDRRNQTRTDKARAPAARPTERSSDGGSMSQPFLSEIRMMSFSFPPKGWAVLQQARRCRSTRIRPCSRCSARSMAATATTNLCAAQSAGQGAGPYGLGLRAGRKPAVKRSAHPDDRARCRSTRTCFRARPTTPTMPWLTGNLMAHVGQSLHRAQQSHDARPEHRRQCR